MCKILTPPESKASFVIMGETYLHSWRNKPTLFLLHVISSGTIYRPLVQNQKKDSKFNHSSLLPQKEGKLNVINSINNNDGLNSNKRDQGI